ncbi:MAG: DUF1266 domain-containing protein [Archangium sp.]|nr:DUF1266 domain-containing protein [Archangium sp.]
MGWLDWLGLSSDLDETRDPFTREISQRLDRALAQVSGGGQLSDHELEACAQDFQRLYQDFSRRFGTGNNMAFPAVARARFYLEAMKLAALGHPEHSAWPLIAGIREKVLPALKKRLASEQDAWVAACAVPAALASGDVPFARVCFDSLSREPALTRQVLAWVTAAEMAAPGSNRPVDLRRFLDGAPTFEPWSAEASGLSNNQRFVLLASMPADLASDPCLTLADPHQPASLRALLGLHWDVRDRASALQVLEWLSTQGHRSRLADDLLDPSLISDPQQRALVVSRAGALRANHIAAWDFCRLISVARASLTAGYLTEEEAWNWVFGAGASLRSTYDGWGSMVDDYVLGRHYQQPAAGPDDLLIESALWLKHHPRSPMRTVPFGG